VPQWIPYPVPTLGTLAVLVVAFLAYFLGQQYVNRTTSEGKEHYRRRQFLTTTVVIGAFWVPSFELKPQVYVTVTSNWVQLTMRYVVEPKKRRSASSFIYQEVFRRVQGSKGITIASETMDLSVHPPKAA
jgi:hypothetical protein